MTAADQEGLEEAPGWAPLCETGPDWGAASRDVGPLPFLRELEGFAGQFNAPGELANLPRVSAEILIAAHRIPVKPVSSPSVDGCCENGVIFVRAGLSGPRLREVLTKEVTRWLLFQRGIRPPEQDIFAGELSLCWQIPYRACQRLRDAGGDFTGAVRAFVRTYQGLTTPELILTRAAQACDVALRLHPAGSAPFDVIPQRTENNMRLTPLEARQLAEEALESRSYARGPDGVKAISYPDGNRLGVAIVLDRGSFRRETGAAFVEAIQAAREAVAKPPT